MNLRQARFQEVTVPCDGEDIEHVSLLTDSKDPLLTGVGLREPAPRFLYFFLSKEFGALGSGPTGLECLPLESI